MSAGPAEIEPDSGKQSTEGRRQYVVVSRCVHDEGGPLGFADQAVLPNHPELHPLRAVVVSVQGKGEMNLVSLPALQVATISLNRRSGAPTTLVNAKNGTTLGAPVFNQADVSR